MKEEYRQIFEGLTDIHLLGLLIYGEARGENLLGKAGVGWTVINRMKDRRWPDTLAGVILQDKQFSCFNEDDDNFPQLLDRAQHGRFHDRTPAWRECQYVAYGVLCNWIIDPTQGANHYHRYDCHPSWDKAMTKVVTIGDHEFFKG